MATEENTQLYFEYLKQHIQDQLKNDEASSWVIEQELNLLEEFVDMLT